VIAGSFLFKLKDTHGLPLDMALDRVIELGHEIYWPSFFAQARKQGWWDYQIDDAIRYGLQDAFIPQAEKDRVRGLFVKWWVDNGPCPQSM